MKRLYALALIATIGLAGNGAVSAQAAPAKRNIQVKSYVINTGGVGCYDELKSILEKLCGDFNLPNLNGCPIITPPECETPETEKPETEKPETEAPETETPETNTPETNTPETETPETNVPETNVPETEAPETNTPETNTPETNAPETEAPETDKEELSFAEQVVQLVNEERTKVGLGEVTLDEAIASAAEIRAKEIEISFSHIRPDGRSFSSVLTDNGIKFKGSGENIAWGQKTPEEVMNAWMNSDGHRANILNPNYKKLGVGVYQNSRGRIFWTQLFTY